MFRPYANAHLLQGFKSGFPDDQGCKHNHRRFSQGLPMMLMTILFSIATIAGWGAVGLLYKLSLENLSTKVKSSVMRFRDM